jgi:hypothetical protein
MESICLILLLGFSVASANQGATQYTNAPDLLIIKSKLIAIVRVDDSRPDPPPNLNEPTRWEANPPRYKWEGKVELEVQNSGSKTIKSIDWEFVLMAELTSEMMTRNYRIHSKKTIRPGQTVKVTGWINDARLKELREHLKRGLLQGEAEIMRVNYAEGGIWLPLKVRSDQPR